MFTESEPAMEFLPLPAPEVDSAENTCLVSVPPTVVGVASIVTAVPPICALSPTSASFTGSAKVTAIAAPTAVSVFGAVFTALPSAFDAASVLPVARRVNAPPVDRTVRPAPMLAV